MYPPGAGAWFTHGASGDAAEAPAFAGIDHGRLVRLQAAGPVEPQTVSGVPVVIDFGHYTGDEVVIWETAVGPMELYCPPSTRHLVTLCLADLQRIVTWHRGRRFAGMLPAGKLLITAAGHAGYFRSFAAGHFLHFGYSQRALQRASASTSGSGWVITLRAHLGFDDATLTALMQALRPSLRGDPSLCRPYLDSVASAVGIHLAQHHREVITARAQGLSDRELESLIALLQQSVTEGATKRDVALRLGQGSEALARRFKQRTGCSLGDFMLRLRLNRAHELLMHGRQSATDIALQLGFADLAHFSRHFSRHFGVPPSKVRERPVF